MLKPRVVTSLVLIPLVIAGVLCLPRSYFMGMTGLFALMAAWEWSGLSGHINRGQRLLYTGFQCVILLSLVKVPLCPWMPISGLIFWLLLAAYVIWARTRLMLPRIPAYLRVGLGWLILTLFWVALQVLQSAPLYLLFMFLVVCLADTAAYMGGHLWGRHLLAPTLSPGKTWEGLGIGLLVTLLLAMLLRPFVLGSQLSLWQTLFLVLLISLAAVLGDLFESHLKRLEGLKDSGSLLPGHGGVLDRVDSLLAAAPVFAGSLVLLGLITCHMNQWKAMESPSDADIMRADTLSAHIQK